MCASIVGNNAQLYQVQLDVGHLFVLFHYYIQNMQGDVYIMYLNPTIVFKFPVFHNFNSLAEVKHEGIMMKWIVNSTTRTNHFALDCLKQHIWVKHKIMVNNNVS